MIKKLFFFLTLFFLAFGQTGIAEAYVASSPSYRIERDSINFGGGLSSSGNYSQENTLGESGTGPSNSGNYSVSAGYQQAGSADTTVTEEPPTGGGGGPTDVYGCTDPLAINYNSSANIDNGGCIYAEEIPNVTNFTAVYDLNTDQINVSWDNPVFDDFQSVRLVRRTGTPALLPAEGNLLYTGSGESFADGNVSLGTVYYYTIFVRSVSGNYSSGVITYEIPSEETEEEEEEEETEEDSPFDDLDDISGGNGGGTELGDFIFTQPQEDRQFFAGGSTIRLYSNKPTTIYLPYDKVPFALKAIGVTIKDPNDPSKTFSFLLRANNDKTAYTATIGNLAPGDYPISIYIINYLDQTVERIEGVLVVRGPLPVEPINFISSILIALGLLAALAQATGVLSSVKSFFDIYAILLRWLGALFGFFGLRKKVKPWGVVYDAFTKQPIDPAYVTVTTVEDPDTEVATAITDIDGRYGLFLPPGTYLIKAGKTNYKFPSEILKGKTNDELYSNLYFGEPFTVGESEVLALNIPIDPVGFDWNEFAKSQDSFLTQSFKRELLKARLANILTGLGFVASLLSVAIGPNWINIGLLSLYFILFGVQMWWQAHHKVVSAIDSLTGKPISFAIIKAYYADVDTEAKHVVTNALGQFYMLLRPGMYYFTVEQRGPDGEYKEIFRSQTMNLPKGVLKSGFKI